MTSFARIEEQKTSLLARVRDWPEQRLLFRARPAEWSAAEVFDHLVRTEAAILNAARAGLANPRRIGLPDRMRTTLLNALFRTRARVKAPGRVTQIVPGAAVRFAEVQERWAGVRSELSAFLQGSSAEDLRKGIFRHPVAGWMNAEGILAFFSVHIIHHGYQLDRLAAASRNSELSAKR